MSFLQHFSANAGEAVNEARDLAKEYEHILLEPEHLLLAFLENQDSLARIILERSGTDPESAEFYLLERMDTLDEEVEGEVTKPYDGDAELEFSPRMIKLLELAVKEMQDLEHDKLGTAHLLIAAFTEPSGLVERLQDSEEIEVKNLQDEFQTYLDELANAPEEERKRTRSHLSGS